MVEKIKHTLLIVDDKYENLISLRGILEKPDREIILCQSGKEALYILLQTKISLLLVDVQMPEMDGYEFVEIIKAHPNTSNIPTIFVTAISDDTKFVNRAFDLGAIDFLYKPLITAITRKKVDSFLRIWDYDELLKTMNNQLEEKNQELEKFAYIVAHDLKSPLHNIQSLIEIIEAEHKPLLNEGILDLFSLIQNSSKK